MCTWLQCNVHGTRWQQVFIMNRCDSNNFCVCITVCAMPSFAYNAAIMHDNTTNKRIWAHLTQTQ